MPPLVKDSGPAMRYVDGVNVTRRGRVIRRTRPARPAETTPLRIGLDDWDAVIGFAGPDFVAGLLSVCFAICSGLSVV
jgi:hypothetical protein